MIDPFQALAWFAGVHVPEADVSNLRTRAKDLRVLAEEMEEIAGRTGIGIITVQKDNDSRRVDRFADLWPNELAPRYAAIAADLREFADACDEYADTVETHRAQLWIIGTQIAALVFTMMFGYLYPAAAAWGRAILKMLIRQARLNRTIFQKAVNWIISRRIGRFKVGTFLLREGLDALADSVLWTVGKTAVHVASSAATGQPIGSIPQYMLTHFAAEMAYNGSIKTLQYGRVALPATKLTETLLGTGPSGKFFRRTLSASLVYNGVTDSMSVAGSTRIAFAHGIRAFRLGR